MNIGASSPRFGLARTSPLTRNCCPRLLGSTRSRMSPSRRPPTLEEPWGQTEFQVNLKPGLTPRSRCGLTPRSRCEAVSVAPKSLEYHHLRCNTWGRGGDQRGVSENFRDFRRPAVADSIEPAYYSTDLIRRTRVTLVPSAGRFVVVLVIPIPSLLRIKYGFPGSPVVGSRAMVAVGDVPLRSAGEGVLDLIASDAVLDEAYAWLYFRRKDDSPHDDVWTLRERWADVKPWLQRSLLRGEYRCDVTRQVHTAEGVIEIWSAADALVLKATALVLQKELAPVLSPRCFHLAGHGGLKGAVRAVDAARRDQMFVFRTDVHGYYASLDHGILYRQVREHVTDRRVLKLVWSYLRRMVCDGGEYEAVTRGISLVCPLSPLMGALYLEPLDDLMERLDLPYVRYMDDWVILAKTRWALRRVVQQVNAILDNLKLEKHPDKTFIGRIDRGFDFLGYRFVAEGLRLAAQTKQRFVERTTRLYEQGAAASRIREYVRHWLTWVRSGCLVHVWDELLVGVLRSSDVLVMVAGGWAGFRVAGGP